MHREASALALSCEKSLLMSDQIHQVGRAFTVEDGEEPYPFGIFSQKTGADGVESSERH